MIKNRVGILLAQKEFNGNRSISMTEFSEQSGVSRSVVYHYLRQDIKNYNDDTLSKFCAYFDCTIGDLLEYVPDDTDEPAPTADEA